MTKLAATNQGQFPVSERTRQLEREARQPEHERGQSFVFICFLRCCACFTCRAAELFPHKNSQQAKRTLAANRAVERHSCFLPKLTAKRTLAAYRAAELFPPKKNSQQKERWLHIERQSCFLQTLTAKRTLAAYRAVELSPPKTHSKKNAGCV